jgi:uncharacterized protein YbcI
MTKHVQAEQMSGDMRHVREPTTRPDLNRALANAVVRCYRRCAGRGPPKAWAFYRGDVVVVMLQGVLTAVERTLVADGRQDAVRRLRAAMRETMLAELADAVEALTGCRVRAALGSDDVDNDVAAEVFMLERPVPRHSDKPTI